MTHLMISYYPKHPVAALDNPLDEEIFSNNQSGTTWCHFLLSCYLGKETNPHLTTTSF